MVYNKGRQKIAEVKWLSGLKFISHYGLNSQKVVKGKLKEKKT